jgi:chaperonin cofactor prefoldin
MNPDTGTLGIPWNNFLTFAAARAATITGLSGNVSTLQSQVATLQSQVATIQSQITTLQSQVSTNTSNISTLQGQVSTLQSQVSTIQGQITALQAEDTNLQNQINVIDQIFASSTVAGLPTPSGNQGRRTNVSDTSIVSFGAPPVGGGTFFAPVYCDGTQWLIG